MQFNTDLDKGDQEDPFRLTGVTQVARFLNTCLPPMGHLFRRFIDYGCLSEEYLVTVSTWPTNEIAGFLSEVSAGGTGGREFSSMEKLILEKHFISYFAKAQT